MGMSCLDCHDYMDGFNRGKKEGTIEELEKLKRRINQLSLGKWYVGRLDGKTEEVASMEEINFVFDKRLSELKGEKNENK